MEDEESMYDISVSVCTCVFVPAVSLNIPTCSIPPVIHSLPGNLQYHSKIKRSAGGDDERYNLAGSAFCGRRLPLIKPFDGLCTMRESEERAALGAEQRRDRACTVTLTITSPPDSATRAAWEWSETVSAQSVGKI